MIHFPSVALLLLLLSLFFPLEIIAHGPLNNLVSTIGATIPSVDTPLICPVLDYSVKINYDSLFNSLTIYFLSLNNNYNTIFTDVHIQSPLESNIRMSKNNNNQSITSFELLSGSIAEPIDMTKTGTGELFPSGGRSLIDRQSAYSTAKSSGLLFQLFNATIPNVRLFNDSTVRVWFTYCLNNGLIDCNTEIFVWRPSFSTPIPSSSENESINNNNIINNNNTNIIINDNTTTIITPPLLTPPIIPPSINFPRICPALNFTHRLIKEISPTNPNNYAYKIVFINLDSSNNIIAELVDVHYKISSPSQSLFTKDWINNRMIPIIPSRSLLSLEQYSWTTGSIIDISRTGTGGINIQSSSSSNLLQYRQEKELLVRKNNIPLQMFEIGGIALNLGDSLNFWFTYCINMQIDCNTEEYYFTIPMTIAKKEQLFQSSSSSPQAAIRSSMINNNQNINNINNINRQQDFNLLNRPLQQQPQQQQNILSSNNNNNNDNNLLIRTNNIIRSAPVLIPSIRSSLPIATVQNNPNLNNNFNLHRSSTISAANNNNNINNNINTVATASITPGINTAATTSTTTTNNNNQLFHTHSNIPQQQQQQQLLLSAAANNNNNNNNNINTVSQPHIRTVYNYEIDSNYGHDSHYNYYYNPHTIRYYVIHDEL